MRISVRSVIASIALCLTLAASAELQAKVPIDDGKASLPPAIATQRANTGERPVAKGLRASASASGSMSGSASGGSVGGGQSLDNGGLMSRGQANVTGSMKLRVALSTNDEDVEQQNRPYMAGGDEADHTSRDDATVMTRVEGGRRITTIERLDETITITDSPSRIIVHRLDRTTEPPTSSYVAATTPRALQAKDSAAYSSYVRYVVRRPAAEPALGAAIPPMDRLFDDTLPNAQ